MMGQDVERILAGINAVKDAAVAAAQSLASSTAYKIVSSAEHAGTAFGHCAPFEIEVPAGNVTSSIKSAVDCISGDCGKMNSLSNGLYTNSSSFNNGYGSPWTELNKLTEAIDNAVSFESSNGTDYVGNKAALLSMINIVISYAVDAKWAIIYYHDYIQRGYDNKYNGNEPSIKFTTGIEKETVGNVNQEFEENVHIKKPSIDPF